ncbi:large terminase subunit [Bacteroides phage crAss001]|uniref:Large terminase subunit n=1 Tax=Bacteroides phage crAss001 TaxID=2301731 RepID=A0A385DVK4_BPCA1|nr:terminase large subunit [Bacteroides phage crAss001]AXQ62662.1 large terminase subunit [Bacteroides phage crAss001]
MGTNGNTIINMNKYQTELTEELMNTLPQEVQEQLLETLTTVEFVKRLISPNRPYARDLPRDEKGRIIVDITNPHIIEDADYFRQPALHFLKYGCYTFLKPNSNPNSEFRRHWDEEKRRCYEGYVRESDGEWVTGFNYWFMNYCPMMVNKLIEGRKKAIRTEAFPFFFEGIYWRFHYLWQAREGGKHAIELAKRGCAKSYSLAAIMSHNLILGESEESNRRVITVLTAYQKEYLKDDKDGTLSKFKPSINFSFANTPFPHLMLKNSPNEMSWQMGYKDEYGVEKGSLNQVLAVSAKDDSEKLRGKRGWILFEEMGSFKGLLSLYDITRKSVEDGDYTFATMYLVGTAAESESDFSSAKTLLYNPDGYNILSIDNVFDRPKQGKPKFGFFFPSYINRAGCYNKDGVSDVVKALIEILIARYKAKYSADPKSVLRVIAEDPITPAEAIIKVKAAYFPITALTERLSQLDQDAHAYDDVYVGKLVQNSNGVEFTPTSDVPIRKFGVENDTPGAIEIFEMPEKDRNEKVPHTRYIIGHDPVDNDQAESSSLSSTFVLDLWTDKIVAEYTGRQSFADDNFEIVRLLCLFYNAKCLYESNKKGIFAYFSKMNCTHLLADTPEFLRDKQLIKYSSFGSNAKGVNASAAINAYANNLIRDWLMKPVTIIQNVDGEDVEVTVYNLNFLRNRALIEELIAFNPEINVDRIRALGMVMLYREDKMVLYQGNPSRDSGEVPKDYLGNDKFFTENYRAVQAPFQKPSKFSTEDAIR